MVLNGSMLQSPLVRSQFLVNLDVNVANFELIHDCHG